MTITNEPVVQGEPIKFILKGFPDEAAMGSSIERFYQLKADADRRFLVFNAFAEEIFSGLTDEDGKIASLADSGRQPQKKI